MNIRNHRARLLVRFVLSVIGRTGAKMAHIGGFNTNMMKYQGKRTKDRNGQNTKGAFQIMQPLRRNHDPRVRICQICGKDPAISGAYCPSCRAFLMQMQRQGDHV